MIEKGSPASHLVDLLDMCHAGVSPAVTPSILRLQLLLDICLGHAPVLGGRARDFPYSEAFSSSLALTNELIKSTQCFQPGRRRVKASYSSFLFLSALRMLLTENRDITRDSKNCDAFIICILEAISQEFSVELSEYFGLIHNEFSAAKKRLRQREIKDFVQRAQRLASFSNDRYETSNIKDIPNIISEKYEIHDHYLRDISSSSVKICRLKPKRIQQLIKNTTSLALQRGASALSAHALGRLRDEISDDSRYSLFTDCDAVVVFLAPVNEPLGFEIKADKVFRSGEAITDWLPRLEPYRDKAIAENIELYRALPSFEYTESAPKSLISVATPSDHSETDIDLSRTVNDRPVSQKRRRNALRCSGVITEQAFSQRSYQVPEWYYDSEDIRFGWAASAFSLAGRSERLLIRSSMRKIVHRLCGTSLPMTESHHQLVRATDGKSLSYIKLDGDHVGRMFSEVSFLEQPSLSQKLSLNLRDRWTTGVKRLVDKFSPKVIPVEPIYMGGDDLLFALPDRFVPEFLQAFFMPMESSELLPSLNFTYVEVEIPVKDRSRSNEQMATSLQCVPEWMVLAKKARRTVNYDIDDEVHDVAAKNGLKGRLSLDRSTIGGNGGIHIRLGR